MRSSLTLHPHECKFGLNTKSRPALAVSVHRERRSALPQKPSAVSPDHGIRPPHHIPPQTRPDMTAAMMTAIKYGAHQPLKSRPAIQVYETMKGLEYVYNEIASDPNIKETLAFLSLDSVPKELDKAAYDLFAKLFEDKKASGREIISIDKGKDHYYLEKTRKLGNYESRVSKGKLFASDTIVYGTKVAMFSFKNQFAIIIDSREISQSIRALFELAWGLK